MSLMNIGISLIAVAALGVPLGLLMSRRLGPGTFALLAAVRTQGWTRDNRARLDRFGHTARNAAEKAPRTIRDIPLADRRLDSMPWRDVLARLLLDLRQVESIGTTLSDDPELARFEDRGLPAQPRMEDAGTGESQSTRLKQRHWRGRRGGLSIIRAVGT